MQEWWEIRLERQFGIILRRTLNARLRHVLKKFCRQCCDGSKYFIYLSIVYIYLSIYLSSIYNLGVTWVCMENNLRVCVGWTERGKPIWNILQNLFLLITAVMQGHYKTPEHKAKHKEKKSPAISSSSSTHYLHINVFIVLSFSWYCSIICLLFYFIYQEQLFKSFKWIKKSVFDWQIWPRKGKSALISTYSLSDTMPKEESDWICTQPSPAAPALLISAPHKEGSAARICDILNVSPSETIVWDWKRSSSSTLVGSADTIPMGDSLICSPESQWLWPAELASTEGMASCTQPKTAVFSS